MRSRQPRFDALETRTLLSNGVTPQSDNVVDRMSGCSALMTNVTRSRDVGSFMATLASNSLNDFESDSSGGDEHEQIDRDSTVSIPPERPIAPTPLLAPTTSRVPSAPPPNGVIDSPSLRHAIAK